nr:YolD-like family protein [Lachnoclostridium phocaeense]
MTEYQDMVTRPHPDPKYHTRMPMENRAAQFAPFSALTGYEEAVEEAHRLTDHRPELSEEEKDALDRALQQALEEIERPVTITRFIPDARKEGGRIVTKKGQIRRLDAYRRRLVLEDGDRIPLDEILDLQSGKE